MIVFVDISIAFRGKPGNGSGRAEIALSCIKDGRLIRQDPEKGPKPVVMEQGTRNRMVLLAVLEGLKAVIRPGQEVCVRLKDPAYLKDCLRNLDRWHGEDFKTSRGPRANEKELRLLWMQTKNQNIRAEALPDETV